MSSVQPWISIYSKRMSRKYKNTPPDPLFPFGLAAEKSGLCFELVAAKEARIGLLLHYISPPPPHPSIKAILASPGRQDQEQKQHVVLFLAGCSEGLCKKAG